MAKVVWSAGIDHVSGALAKPGSNPQHSCERMLLATHRTAPTCSNDCNRLYMQKKAKRTTPITADELKAKARFTAVEAMVRARKNDLSHMSEDQVNFAEQKNLANGCKTMKKYLWSICGAEYDQQHG